MFIGTNAGATSFNSNTDWFKEAKYGVFCHYLPNMNNITATSSADWNNSVNSFDVNAFANQVAQTGAKYVIITLGQNSAYYCSPNSVYDSYTGPGKCSTRDLPNDLFNALNPKGIKLMFYITSSAACSDTPVANAAAYAMGVTYRGTDTWDNWQLTPTFRSRWSEVLQEWSDRYGSKIAGWWVDGAYDCVSFDDTYAISYSTALKHGNPNSIVCFDKYPTLPDSFYSSEDYTAGEMNDLALFPASNRWSAHNTQNHVLSFLGSWWGYTDVLANKNSTTVLNYINDANARGGVITLDMGILKNGSLNTAQVNLMASIKQSLRGTSCTVPHIGRSVTATSQQTGYEASNMLDSHFLSTTNNALTTIWHTKFSPTQDILPQNITYSLGGNYPVNKLRYMPRQDQTVSMNGNITQYEVYVSPDNINYTKVANGTWADNGTEKIASFSSVSTAYVRLVAIAGHGGYASASNINVEYVAPQDPVGYWQINETSDIYVYDESGNNNIGNKYNAQWTTGKNGGALNLNGINEYISLGNPTSLNITGQITLAAWVKAASDIGTSGIFNIIARGYNTDKEVFLRINGTSYQVGTWNGANSPTASYSIPATDKQGSWVHIAGVWDGSKWILYRNGENVAQTYSSVAPAPVATGWAIGARSTGTERFFKGAVDNVKIYNIALTAQQMQDLYDGAQ